MLRFACCFCQLSCKLLQRWKQSESIQVTTWRKSFSALQSRPKVHLSCIVYPPSPLINVGKYRVFSNKKGKNHLIINIESGGRGEFASCSNSFVRDCRCRPSDRVWKKLESYVEKFSNIMWKKVAIMRKRHQIMRKFPKLIKLFPLFFPHIKYVNILPKILVLYDTFDLLMPFVDRYFFALLSFSIVFVVPKFSKQALNQTRKTRTQAHHRKMHETPGGFKLFTSKMRVFVAILDKQLLQNDQSLWVDSCFWLKCSNFLVLCGKMLQGCGGC